MDDTLRKQRVALSVAQGVLEKVIAHNRKAFSEYSARADILAETLFVAFDTREANNEACLVTSGSEFVSTTVTGPKGQDLLSRQHQRYDTTAKNIKEKLRKLEGELENMKRLESQLVEEN